MPLLLATDRAAGDAAVVSNSVVISRDELRHRLRWWSRLVWREKHLVLACVLLILVPTVLFLQQATPRYAAEARIMIEAPEARDALDERLVNNRPMVTEALVQTEADLLLSTVLAHRAIDKLHLLEDPEFNGKLRPPRPMAVFLSWLNPLTWLAAEPAKTSDEPALRVRQEMELAAVTRAFLQHESVRVPPRSFVITVRFTSENREKAALIANTLADLYVLDRLEASFEQAKRVSDWLRERLETLRHDVEVAETAAEGFRAANGLRRKGEQSATLKDQQLSELNNRLAIARADLAQKQARLEQIRGLAHTHGGVDATSDVLQSPLIQHLREQEAQISREMSDALKTYGERHPRIMGYRADLEELRAKIAHEVEKIASSIANDMEIAAAGVRSLEKEFEATRRQSNVAGEAEIKLRELERQAETSRTVYEAFLGRFKRQAENGDVQRANARVISPADIPIAPSYPNKPSSLLLAFVAAVGLGIGLIFLLDQIDSSVRSADEAELLAETPTLAMIPLQRGRTTGPVDLILKRPRSSLADAVRSLRTALDLGCDPGTRQTILVTSSVPREGKTFVSLCLALLYAKAYPRVLLIDGDVHRPTLFRTLGVPGERGLVQILKQEATPDQVILPAVAGTLDFLPAGQGDNLAELLTESAMATLLARLTEHYDRIVIDSPPVLAVTDSRVLGRLANRVVYLIKWNATPRDAIRNGLKLLRSAGVVVFGVALSQVNQRKHDGYGYSDYGYYYGRYRDYYGES